MKEGLDGFRITFFDGKEMDSCSLVIEGFHRFFLCNKDERLEVEEHDLYNMIKEFFDK